ncbi:alpha/beta-hydrolase [Durotheca rogersii]|uniref:alpha/beta-hydrolase n=1 Tax=Durotheca rogersii TaxID=419775 RepID=UPI0022210CA2|nr:alpha/beta-hydrolase [Durotheca rogersii]KAI5863823.1 alpha/beta-hydrolase [Durotheca rogersii]
MYDELSNPILVHEGPPTRANSLLAKPRAPLVLVHDGGGTTFSYCLLDPIGRPVWGIQNANLHRGGWWDGGISEMAAHYIRLLAKVLPQGGDILLGGWSLGGHLSLEMAYQIAKAARDDSTSSSSSTNGGSSANGDGNGARTPVPKFRVLGMIFIDTIFPRRLAELRGPLPTQPLLLSPEASRAMKLKEKVDVNMTHARMMVGSWAIPRWAPSSSSAASTSSGSDNGNDDGGKEDDEEGAEPRPPAPPTILLRAKEFVAPDSSKAFVDHVRDFRLLGWDEYNAANGGFIREVVDVEGHHFSIFKDEHLTGVSRKISAAADKLDPPGF